MWKYYVKYAIIKIVDKSTSKKQGKAGGKKMEKSKNKGIRIFAVIVVIVISTMLVINLRRTSTELKNVFSELEEINKNLEKNNSTEDLKKELQQKEETIEQLKKAQEDDNVFQAYVNMKLPRDGKKYICDNEEDVTFYSDVYCTQKINVESFSSKQIDEGYADNGNHAYILRTSIDTIVYSTQWPDLRDENQE